MGTDWHLSGEKLVHLLLTCWTALGCWGCLVFFFTLLSTSWDSWNWWKPDTLSNTATFPGGDMVHMLLTCWATWVSASHYHLLLGTPGTYGTTDTISMLEKCLGISPLLLHSCTSMCFVEQITYFSNGCMKLLPVLPFEQIVLGSLHWLPNAIHGQNLTPSTGTPTQKHCPTLALLFSTTLGLPCLGHCILLTTFCAQKIFDLLLLSKLCGIFHGILATSSGEERGVR